MNDAEREVVDQFRTLVDADHADQDALDRQHADLVNRRLLGRVTVHRYQCAKHGCQVATVFRVAGRTLCAVRDYKLSPGLNAERSVPEARARNTLDGERHWPGHVYDVDKLGRAGPAAGIDMPCRHQATTVKIAELMASIADVTPGRPGKPTQL